ncbi:hypothetical protein EDD15DRAFT_2203927 [Pisolithus albus]|nr:hypothetical protein EDD15DRAFT_2203927 [Pisolithus albus]
MTQSRRNVSPLPILQAITSSKPPVEGGRKKQGYQKSSLLDLVDEVVWDRGWKPTCNGSTAQPDDDDQLNMIGHAARDGGLISMTRVRMVMITAADNEMWSKARTSAGGRMLRVGQPSAAVYRKNTHQVKYGFDRPSLDIWQLCFIIRCPEGIIIGEKMTSTDLLTKEKRWEYSTVLDLTGFVISGSDITDCEVSKLTNRCILR